MKLPVINGIEDCIAAKRKTAQELNPEQRAIFDDFCSTMQTEVIPEIVRVVDERERIANRYRLGLTGPKHGISRADRGRK